MAFAGFPPGIVLYQEQAMSKPFKDLLPPLTTPGSRHDTVKSGIILLRPFVQADLFKSRSALYGHSHFRDSDPLRRMPLCAAVEEMQGDSILFSFGMDEQWTKHSDMWQLLMSGSIDFMEGCLDPSIVSDLKGLQAIPANMNSQRIGSIDFQLNNCYGAPEYQLQANANYYYQETDRDLVSDLPDPTISVHPDGRLSLVGSMTGMKDLASVFAEFAVTKDSARRTKSTVLVPHFRWNDVIDLHDHVHPPLILETVTAAPHKSPQKVKLKRAHKRKTKKVARETDLYRNNSLHPFETILSLMMDKRRNGKSMMNSLKKSGPELHQFLTQFSASIAGTGLAVMFSVIYKVACGSVPFCTSNLLTSAFGVGLFWLSCAVNRLRDTIININKNFCNLGSEEEEMMVRVDKSVNDIFFRVTALMAVLILRFA